MNIIKSKLKLIGYTAYCDESENFMLPIFGDHKAIDLFAIQYVDELTELVISFKKVELKRSELKIIEPRIEVGIGDDPVYVFLDAKREIFAGNLASLRGVLLRFESENPYNAGTSLQIKELLGSQDEKRSARKKIRNLMFDHSNADTAKNFLEGSVLRMELWKILLNSAPSKDAAINILNARAKISAKIDNCNIVSIDLSALSPCDYGNIDVSEITRNLQLEIDITVRPEVQIEEEAYIEGSFSADDITKHVSRARSFGRQEERIAVILRYVLEDFELGREVIKSYKKDRSAFASEAVRLISLSIAGQDSNKYIAKVVAESLVLQLYRKCFPMNRGALLYYFAKHLGKHRNLNNLIRDVWQKSGAIFVHQWDNLIARELDGADKLDEPKNAGLLDDAQ